MTRTVSSNGAARGFAVLVVPAAGALLFGNSSGATGSVTIAVA